MASTFGNADFVQNSYSQNWSRGFAGQLVSVSSLINITLETAATEEDIIMGRGVVEGVTQPQLPSSNVPFTAIAPFSVALPDPGSVAADLVGITYRPLITTTNIEVANVNFAGYRENDFAAIVPFGSRQQIYVDLPVGAAIAVKEAVYIAINATNDPDIPVGAFMNDSLGTTGLLLVPNALWWITKTTTADNTIGVINLL